MKRLKNHTTFSRFSRLACYLLFIALTYLIKQCVCTVNDNERWRLTGGWKEEDDAKGAICYANLKGEDARYLPLVSIHCLYLRGEVRKRSCDISPYLDLDFSAGIYITSEGPELKRLRFEGGNWREKSYEIRSCKVLQFRRISNSFYILEKSFKDKEDIRGSWPNKFIYRVF